MVRKHILRRLERIKATEDDQDKLWEVFTHNFDYLTGRTDKHHPETEKYRQPGTFLDFHRCVDGTPFEDVQDLSE